MSNFIVKLLNTRVQTKEVEDIDIKKLQKELKKKGMHFTKEELQKKVQEYSDAIEERRKTRLCTISYIVTLVSLLLLAIQEELRKLNIIQFSNTAQILILSAGFSTIGFSWLFYYLQLKKKYKLSGVLLILTLLVEAGLMIAASMF